MTNSHPVPAHVRRRILRSGALALLAAAILPGCWGDATGVLATIRAVTRAVAIRASHQQSDSVRGAVAGGDLPTPAVIALAWHPTAGLALALASAGAPASRDADRTAHADAGRMPDGGRAMGYGARRRGELRLRVRDASPRRDPGAWR